MTARSAPFGWSAPATLLASHETSDDTLIHRIATGDKGAMRILFGRHQVRLYRFTLRLVRDEGLAEDLVNEVFLEVWRHADRFEGRSTVLTWLLAIARHAAASTLRKRKEVELDEAAACQVADPTESPEAALDRTDRGKLIRKCLARISSDHLQVIDL